MPCKYAFILLLILSSSSVLAEDQLIADLSKSKSYYCIENDYFLALKTKNAQGEIVRTKIYKKKKARRIYKSYLLKIKNTKQAIKLSDSKRQQSKLKLKLAGYLTTKDNLKKCLNKTLQFASNLSLTSGSLPENLELPATTNSSNTLTGSFPGDCQYKSTSIPAYQPGNDNITLAPLSGQFFCDFTSESADFGDLLLKVYRRGAPQEIIFSKTVPRDQIKPGYKFIVTVCTEFPGCFYSNLLAKTAAEVGLDISLERMPAE